MNNEVIDKQLDGKNDRLSNLCLSYVCISFEKMPFCTSLQGHNPRLNDLFDSIDSTNRMHEVLARYVLINTEKNKQLYTWKNELDKFGEIDYLVNTFNSKLYNNAPHQAHRLDEQNGHFHIRDYENDTLEIINKLITFSHEEIQNYTDYVEHWLSSGVHPVDCNEKKAALKKCLSIRLLP